MRHSAASPGRPEGDGRPLGDFREEVGAIASRLRLPIPARTRLVRELYHDLDGLTRRLVMQGLAQDEARRRAAEILVPDAATLQEMERMGTPRYGRLTASLDPDLLRRVERATLVLSMLAILGLEAWALLSAGLLDDPSPFLWPVLAMGAVLLTTVLAKGFELWIRGSHHRPRRGLSAIAGLSLCTIALGCGGALVDLTLLATTLEAVPERALTLTTAWLVRTAALLSTAIILSVTGGLGWLVASGWVTHAEHDHLRAIRHAESDDHRAPNEPRPGVRHDRPGGRAEPPHLQT